MKPSRFAGRPSTIHRVRPTFKSKKKLSYSRKGQGMRLNNTIVGALITLLVAGVAAAQGNPQRPGRGEMPPGQAASGQAEGAKGQEQKPLPPPEEKSSVTHHSARIGGQEINYTATAATYVIKADDGKPKAVFFYVAYTKDGVPDVSKRPISFVYNGGPGSASL